MDASGQLHALIGLSPGKNPRYTIVMRKCLTGAFKDAVSNIPVV
jgi:hypothetical protein